MGSRLRGMTILSSTIIPRTQRLLETGVLKERPVWLDVVEAYPPLPPPSLPPSLQKGRSPEIVYPEDDQPSTIMPTTSGMSKLGRLAWNVISVFEAPSVVKVERWKPDRFDVEDKVELATEQTEQQPPTLSARSDEVMETIANRRLASRPAPNRTRVLPNFEVSIGNLSDLLKQYEKKD